MSEKTTEFIVHLRLDGHLEGEYDAEELEEIFMNRLATYFPDDEPSLKGSIGVKEIRFLHRSTS